MAGYVYAPDTEVPSPHECRIAAALDGVDDPPRRWTCQRCGITWRRYGADVGPVGLCPD